MLKYCLVLFLLVPFLGYSQIDNSFLAEHSYDVYTQIKSYKPSPIEDNDLKGSTGYLLATEDNKIRGILYTYIYFGTDYICYKKILLCDYKMYSSTIDYLNKNYSKVSENTWLQEKETKRYVYTIEKWSAHFIITIQ
jgi:hypothetical protein